MIEKGRLVECRECGGEIDTMATSGYEHVLDEGKEWWWCQECARVKAMERVIPQLVAALQTARTRMLRYGERRSEIADIELALAEAGKVPLG